jgi:hypothetical protein
MLAFYLGFKFYILFPAFGLCALYAHSPGCGFAGLQEEQFLHIIALVVSWLLGFYHAFICTACCRPQAFADV